MRSMTGYGRGQANRAGMNLTAEIKTVNHRYLDVSVRLPKSLLPLEVSLRKHLGERFTRGRVELSISQDSSGAQASLVKANLPLAHDYAQAARQVAEAAGIIMNMPSKHLDHVPKTDEGKMSGKCLR